MVASSANYGNARKETFLGLFLRLLRMLLHFLDGLDFSDFNDLITWAADLIGLILSSNERFVIAYVLLMAILDVLLESSVILVSEGSDSYKFLDCHWDHHVVVYFRSLFLKQMCNNMFLAGFLRMDGIFFLKMREFNLRDFAKDFNIVNDYNVSRLSNSHISIKLANGH